MSRLLATALSHSGALLLQFSPDETDEGAARFPCDVEGFGGVFEAVGAIFLELPAAIFEVEGETEAAETDT